MTVDQMEKEMILQALDRTAGNRTLAAEQLGMSRRTLHRKLNAFGVTRRVVDEPDESNGGKKMRDDQAILGVVYRSAGPLV